MNLGLYNVLSQLISGFLVYLVCLHTLEFKSDILDPISTTVIAYILGYFINALSAWSEWFLNWTWRGKPSTQLLEGKSCNQIKFSEYLYAKRLLKGEIKKRNPSTDDLFKLAVRLADNEGRIAEMNGQYAFSRSLLIALLITLIILGFGCWNSIVYWVISVIILLITWYRTKERGFYYAREVLYVALNKLEKMG